MRLIPLLSLAFVVTSPAWADDDVCTCDSGAFDWSGLTDPNGWTCVGPSGSISANDSFIIRDGCTRRVVGDLTLTAGDSCIQVLNGGSLSIEVGAVSNQSIRVSLGGGQSSNCHQDLDLGPAGLYVDANSTIETRGAWRSYGASVPTLVSDPSVFGFGDLQPCSDAGGTGAQDCSSTPHLQRIHYPFATYAPGAPADELDRLRDSFQAIHADDVLVFVDSDPNDVFASTDHLAMYEIDSANALADSGEIVFDSRQGEAAYGNFPRPRRQVKTTTLTAPALATARALSLSGDFIDSGPSGVFENSRHPIGHWVRCGGDPVAPFADVGNAWTIQRVIDGDPNDIGTPDLILLADRRGIGSPCAAGDVLFVDMGGWRVGDEIAVMVPVRFESGTPAESDSNVVIEGTTSISETIFEATHRVMFRYSTSAGQDVDWGGHVWFKDLVGRDPCGTAAACTGPTRSQAAKVDFEDLPSGSEIHHVLMTGGMDHAVAVDDAFHGFGVRGGPNVHYSDFMVRHGEDDSFLTRNAKDGSGTGRTLANMIRPDGFEISRFRCQFRADGGMSQDCIQVVASLVDGSAREIESVNATTDSGPIGHTSPGNAAAGVYTMTVDGLLSLNNDGGWSFTQDLVASDVTWIDGVMEGAVGRLQDSILRDWDVGDHRSTYMQSDFSGHWSDVVVENFTFRQTRRGYYLCNPQPGCSRTLAEVHPLFENVAWINGSIAERICTGCAMLQMDNGASSGGDLSTYTFANNTWIWTPDCADHANQPFIRDCQVKWFTSRLEGVGGDITANTAIFEAARIVGLNQSVVTDPAVWNLTAADLVKIAIEPPLCVDSDGEEFFPDPNGPSCGADGNAGVKRLHLYHSWRRLQPEKLSDHVDVDGDGETGFFDTDDDDDGLDDVTEPDHGTDPINPDTDGDGYLDGEEVGVGSDPLDAGSTPIRPIPILPGVPARAT